MILRYPYFRKPPYAISPVFEMTHGHFNSYWGGGSGSGKPIATLIFESPHSVNYLSRLQITTPSYPLVNEHSYGKPPSFIGQRTQWGHGFNSKFPMIPSADSVEYPARLKRLTEGKPDFAASGKADVGSDVSSLRKIDEHGAIVDGCCVWRKTFGNLGRISQQKLRNRLMDQQ